MYQWNKHDFNFSNSFHSLNVIISLHQCMSDTEDENECFGIFKRSNLQNIITEIRMEVQEIQIHSLTLARVCTHSLRHVLQRSQRQNRQMEIALLLHPFVVQPNRTVDKGALRQIKGLCFLQMKASCSWQGASLRGERKLIQIIEIDKFTQDVAPERDRLIHIADKRRERLGLNTTKSYCF